jgi:hypothetical protein
MKSSTACFRRAAAFICTTAGDGNYAKPHEKSTQDMYLQKGVICCRAPYVNKLLPVKENSMYISN